MKRIVSLLVVAAGLLSSSAARADYIQMQLSSYQSSVVQFDRTSQAFSFTNVMVPLDISTTVPANTTIGAITQGSGSSTDASGLFALISGSFQINAATWSGPGAYQTAQVTTSNGKLTIYDGSTPATWFTADLNLTSIYSLGTIGGTDGGVDIALTNFQYGGSGTDLTKLFGFGTGDLSVSLQLQAHVGQTGPIDLAYLLGLDGRDPSVTTYNSSYSASVNSPSIVPVPASWLMLASGTGLLGGAGFWRRRYLALA